MIHNAKKAFEENKRYISAHNDPAAWNTNVGPLSLCDAIAHLQRDVDKLDRSVDKIARQVDQIASKVR